VFFIRKNVIQVVALLHGSFEERDLHLRASYTSSPPGRRLIDIEIKPTAETYIGSLLHGSFEERDLYFGASYTSSAPCRRLINIERHGSIRCLIDICRRLIHIQLIDIESRPTAQTYKGSLL